MARLNTSSLTRPVRNEIEKMYWRNASVPLGTEQLVAWMKQIGSQYGFPFSLIEAYYDKFAMSRTNDQAVTVFVKDADWVKGEKCFDVRVGTQWLRYHSWVVAFFSQGDRSLYIPNLKNDEQRLDLINALEDALILSGDLDTDAASLLHHPTEMSYILFWNTEHKLFGARKETQALPAGCAPVAVLLERRVIWKAAWGSPSFPFGNAVSFAILSFQDWLVEGKSFLTWSTSESYE